MRQVIPGAEFSPSTMSLRLRSKASTMAAITDWSPVSASTDAHCEMEVGLDVDWLCSISTFFITSASPAM